MNLSGSILFFLSRWANFNFLKLSAGPLLFLKTIPTSPMITIHRRAGRHYHPASN